MAPQIRERMPFSLPIPCIGHFDSKISISLLRSLSPSNFVLIELAWKREVLLIDQNTMKIHHKFNHNDKVDPENVLTRINRWHDINKPKVLNAYYD